MYKTQYTLPIKPDLKHFVLNTPFKSDNKIKSLLEDEYKVKVPNYFMDKYIIKDKKYDKKEAKKLQYKTYSMPGGFIGDIFFPLSGSRNSAESAAIPIGRKIAFLLLIEINTRIAYAYQLGNVNVKEIINVDEEKYEREIEAETIKLKTTQSLINAMERGLKDFGDRIRSLRFDGESGINSKVFQDYLKTKRIKFIPTLKGQHTSLSLIDRLSRTIRDMAYNMNVEIVDQSIMDMILEYYNISPHKTLTKTFFQINPELKKMFPHGIAPVDVNDELEELYIKECYKYNIMINNQNAIQLDWKTPTYCRIYEQRNKFDKVRSKLSRDVYIIVGKEGNMYKLQNAKNNTETKYAPRFRLYLLQPSALSNHKLV